MHFTRGPYNVVGVHGWNATASGIRYAITFDTLNPADGYRASYYRRWHGITILEYRFKTFEGAREALWRVGRKLARPEKRADRDTTIAA